MKRNATQLLPQSYEVLAALFITSLLISNIVSIKLVNIGHVVFDAGSILFPLAYIIGDVIAEVYGFKQLKKLLFTGICMLVLTASIFWIVGALPAASDWGDQAAYDSILGVVWRIVGASIIAIMLGELINAYILTRLKVRMKGKQLWTRLIGSSAVGNLVDTTVFTVIAFAGTTSNSTLLNIIVTVYVIKMATEIAISPITMKLIAFVKKRDNIDVYETPELAS